MEPMGIGMWTCHIDQSRFMYMHSHIRTVAGVAAMEIKTSLVTAHDRCRLFMHHGHFALAGSEPYGVRPMGLSQEQLQFRIDVRQLPECEWIWMDRETS